LIFLSGTDEIEDKIKAWTWGRWIFVSKPFNTLNSRPACGPP